MRNRFVLILCVALMGEGPAETSFQGPSEAVVQALQAVVPERLTALPEFAKISRPLPAMSEDYPPELRAAVIRYLEVSEPFRKLAAAETRKIDFQTYEQEYGKLVADLAAGTGSSFTERVIAYQWGGFCGTGSYRFHAPHSYAVLLALARDGRWEEAVGAALQVTPEGDVDGAVRVLFAALPDAVDVLVGGLALGALKPHDFWQERFQATLALLLRSPGDDRVRSLTMLAARSRPEFLPLYFDALGKFVELGPRLDSTKWTVGRSWSSEGNGIDDIVARPVGPEAQKLALDFLCAQASPSLPVEAASQLARIFEGKRRPEAIPALHRLREHPSFAVAKVAVEALVAVGQKAVVPAKLGPVRYRLLVDGEPYAERDVTWHVSRKGQSTGSQVKSSTEVRKRVLGLLPDGPEFEGADVPFTVKLASPHQLDLGNIPLKERP